MVEKIGRFEIIRVLGDGEGHMAEVYEAKDTLIGRQVAIKLLPKHSLRDPKFKSRFEIEAKNWAQLNHASIVPLHDFGYHGDQPYMVTRYMEGGSLHGLLQKRGKLSLQETLELIEPICSALAAIHKKNLVHRDVKPANILLDEEGRTHLSDFGIAKLLEGSVELERTAVVGTPGYMSPEQWRAENELSGRSDQYSLAVMIFEMLSGELPFKADTLAGMMHKHLFEPPPSITKLRKGLPEGVAQVLERALDKNPAQRHKDMGAFLGALQTAAMPLPEAPPEKPPVKETKPVKEQRDIGAKVPPANPTRLLEEEEAKRQGKKPEPSQRTRLPGLAYAAFALPIVAALAWALSQGQPPTVAEETLTPIAIVSATRTPEPTNTLTLNSNPTEIPRPKVPTGATFLRTLTGNPGGINSVAFSPDGELLASGGNDNTVHILRIVDGELLQILHTGNESLPTSSVDYEKFGGINSVAFSPDGQFLASGAQDNTVRIWRVADGELLYTLAHTRPVMSVDISPDGQLLASSTRDSSLNIWHMKDGELLHTLRGHSFVITSVTFSPNGEFLASGAEDSTVRIWRVANGELLRTLAEPSIALNSVAFSPDGELIASGGASEGGLARIWRVADGELLNTLTIPSSVPITSLAFSPDGQLLASGSDDQIVRIWRTEDGELLSTLSGHQYSVKSVAFSPDGQFLASGSYDRTVIIWQITYADQ